MGERETFSAPIGTSTRTESGAWATVVITSTNAPRTATNSTAVHEAVHIVTAENNNTPVVSATIVQSGDALGSTELSRPDPVAAMGPHAHGHSGTSWDVYISMRMGANTETAASASRAIISANYHQVNPVAVALEDHKTLSGAEIRNVMREADEVRNHGPKITVDIFIKNSDGSEQKLTQETRGENVVVSGEWIANQKPEEEEIEPERREKIEF